MCQAKPQSVWGLDIAKGRWACVKLILGPAGQVAEIRGVPLAYDPTPVLTDDCLLAIADVPLGIIPDSEASDTKGGGRSGDRPVDRGARKWVLSSGSVAPPPTQEQYLSGMEEHARAARATSKADRRRKLDNVKPPGLNQIGFQMIPAMASGAATKAGYPGRLFESHPEVVFAVLAGGIIPGGKKTLSGTLGRALYLTKRIGIDCMKWVMKQELESDIGVDDWLDAVSMALVAYDWRQKDKRVMLYTANGIVQKWRGESDRLMAIPATDVGTLPEEYAADEYIDRVLSERRGEGTRERLTEATGQASTSSS